MYIYARQGKATETATPMGAALGHPPMTIMVYSSLASTRSQRLFTKLLPNACGLKGLTKNCGVHPNALYLCRFWKGNGWRRARRQKEPSTRNRLLLGFAAVFRTRCIS